MDRTRVAIICEVGLQRLGLKCLLDGHSEFVLCGECTRLKDGATMVAEIKPELLVVDIYSRTNNGLETLKNLHALFRTVKILVVSSLDEGIYATRAIRGGALGYITTHRSPEEITAAMRKVRAGEVYVSEEIGAAMLNLALGKGASASTSPLGLLSDRELEIVTLMTQCGTVGEIADKLNLSVTTVHSHRNNIKRKCNVKSLPELVRQAVGLLDGGASRMQHFVSCAANADAPDFVVPA